MTYIQKNIKISQYRPERLFLSLLVLAGYIAFVIVYFWNQVIYFDVYWITIFTTCLILILGPLRVVGGQSKLYDPVIIVLSGMFYYVFKGFGLALGNKTLILSMFSFNQIRQSYTESCILLSIAVIIICLFNLDKRQFSREKKGSEFKIGVGFYLVLGVGLVFLILFINAMNFNILHLTLYPSQRGYMSMEGGFGGGLAFIYYYGFQMLGIVSIVRLAYYGQENEKPSFGWYLFSGIYVVILLLLTPRTTLLIYVISALMIYHLKIRKIKTSSFVIAGVSGIIYIYATRVWRAIVGGMSRPDIGTAFEKLLPLINSRIILDNLLLGTDLSDIRIFVLINNTYGEILPLYYGNTFLRIIYQFIPRILWSNKPIDIGVEIGQLFLPGTSSGTPPGFFGEMYMNFAVPGIFLGALIIGILIRLLKIKLGDLSSSVNLITYSFIAPRLLLVSSTGIANFITNMAILLIGIYLCVGFLQGSNSSNEDFRINNKAKAHVKY